VTFKSKN